MKNCQQKSHACGQKYTKKHHLVGGFNPSEKYESQMG